LVLHSGGRPVLAIDRTQERIRGIRGYRPISVTLISLPGEEPPGHAENRGNCGLGESIFLFFTPESSQLTGVKKKKKESAESAVTARSA
jgi:hypothetical protein